MNVIDGFYVDPMTDFDELNEFSCGHAPMDDFLRNHLRDCEESHYCKSFSVRSVNDATLVAVFALAFDSVDVEADDFDDMRIGATGTGLPHVNDAFRVQFEQKSTYPALEIAYLAVSCDCQRMNMGRALLEEIIRRAKHQEVAGCVFLSVKAWHTPEYSAVPFYEKNGFARLTPLPQGDVWPMYCTIWPDEV